MSGDWSAWVGREERQADYLGEALARRFCATFDLPPALPGSAMPQGIHFCLCTPEAPTAALGDDGHPRRGAGEATFLPPVPLPRRMWAASRIAFHRPIIMGRNVERVSRIASITEKTGGSGKLVFVDIDHETRSGGDLAVSERQTLVYREAADRDAPLAPPEAPTGTFDLEGWDAYRTVTPEPALLFRYSALTFNSHRIHYDLAYARDIERYRGLVVHGPLIASFLLQLAAAQFGHNRLASFEFRGVSPAVVGEPLHLAMRGAGDCIDMAVFSGDRRQVTAAQAVLR